MHRLGWLRVRGRKHRLLARIAADHVPRECRRPRPRHLPRGALLCGYWNEVSESVSCPSHHPDPSSYSVSAISRISVPFTLRDGPMTVSISAAAAADDDADDDDDDDASSSIYLTCMLLLP